MTSSIADKTGQVEISDHHDSLGTNTASSVHAANDHRTKLLQCPYAIEPVMTGHHCSAGNAHAPTTRISTDWPPDARSSGAGGPARNEQPAPNRSVRPP